MNNPPAFPVVGMQQKGNQPFMGVFYDGMTLRDYFAGQALAGFCSSVPMPSKDYYSMAAGCYLLADAMLEERDRK